MSSDLLQLVEVLVMAYKSSLIRLGSRPDGRTPEQLAAAFRVDTRADILSAIAKGNAMMIRAAGLSSRVCRKHAYTRKG